jgi:hypothetical protein
VNRTSCVDAGCCIPDAEVVNLHVPSELEATLARPVAQTDRTIHQVALDLLAGRARRMVPRLDQEGIGSR